MADDPCYRRCDHGVGAPTWLAGKRTPMKSTLQNNRTFHRLGLAAGFSVLLTWLLAGAALAGSNAITINTNDGLDDPNWTETPFRHDPAGDAGSGYDIRSFWVGADAYPPNTFFFRAELNAALPVEGYVEARLDCNLNGEYFDSSDISVIYVPFSSSIDDAVYVTQGDFNGMDFYRPEHGEATSTTGAYEWKAPATGTNTDWTSCLGEQVSVILVTVSYPASRDEDLTEARIFGAPTAVDLVDLRAASASWSRLVYWVIPVLVLLAACLLALNHSNAGQGRL
jgi:hypothetical protein